MRLNKIWLRSKNNLLKIFFPKNADYTRQKIGEQIKLMREQRGIKRSHLCRDTGLNRKQLLDIELARTNYTIDSYLAVINYLSEI